MRAELISMFSLVSRRNRPTDHRRSGSTLNSLSWPHAKVAEHPAGLQYLSDSERSARCERRYSRSFLSLQAVSTPSTWRISNRIRVGRDVSIVRFAHLSCSFAAEDLSVTTAILTSIGIHQPTYDDCFIIREVCKTVSLRASKLAAAGKQRDKHPSGNRARSSSSHRRGYQSFECIVGHGWRRRYALSSS